MRPTRKQLLAVFLVAIMVLAAPAAAAPSIDNETTNTSTTSEIVSDTVLAGFNANADNSSELEVIGENGTSPVVEITRNDSDTVVYSNDSLSNETRVSGGTHWNASFTHDELADLEHTIDENVTMDLVMKNGSNTSDTSTIQFFVNATDERTVENLGDTDADPDTSDAPVTTEDLENTLTRVTTGGIHTLSFSDLDVEDRAVNGQDTDVVIVFSNGTVADHASDAVPDDVEDGDAMYGFTFVVHGDEGPTKPIRVYHEEVPDDVDEDEDTYGVYHAGGIGGEDGVEINLGDEYEDEDEVSVTGRMNAGQVDRIQHFVATTSAWQSTVGGLFGALSFDGVLTGSVVPTIALGAFAVRRRRLAG